MKNKVTITIVSLAILLTIGITYAYFSNTMEGNESQIKIASKELMVIFTDTTEISDLEITPGWTTSKTFTVENKSSGTYNYNIVFLDLLNTFVNDNTLQYKITSTNGGYNMESWADIPKSQTPEDTILVYDVDIEVGVTQEYKIEFRYYDDPNKDQSEDIGKDFTGSLAIAEGTINPNIKYTVTLNAENTLIDPNTKETIKNGSVEFNVTPNEGYELGTNVICDNDAIGTIENNKVIVSKVTSNTTCTLNNDKTIYTIEMKVTNGKSNALNKLIPYGESDTFTITPNTGYTLEGAVLTGDNCTIEGNIVTVSNVTSNGVCELTLAKEKYKVILTGENITSDSPKTVEYEGSTTFNVTPSEGFTLSNASVNCDGGASAEISGNTVTVSNVLQGQTCTITPKQIEYDLTLVVENGTGNATKVVKHGESTTFEIEANTGYTTDSPTISCSGSASSSISGSNVTISNVTTKQTCTVTLKKATYTVNVTSTNNNYGTVSPTSSSVTHGDSLEITLTPKSGYEYSTNNCDGTVNDNKMIISNITSDKTCTITFKTITPTGKTLYSVLTSGQFYPTVNTRTSFDSILGDKTATTKTIYKESIYKESGNDVYYFAGNVADNWVKFAGFYWRIIRTNEDGSVRLLYAGDSPSTTEGYISEKNVYNEVSSNTMYVGYMYGSLGSISNNRMNETNSTAKNVVDSWYLNNIANNSTYNNMISPDAIYCNDRASGSYSSNGYMYYAAANRLYKLDNSGRQPSYQCGQNTVSGYINTSGKWTSLSGTYSSAAPSSADKFNVSGKNGGNGKLTYPVALMTADEVAFAGGLYAAKNQYLYYYQNSTGESVTGHEYWRTMTPYFFTGSEAIAFTVFGSGSEGMLNGNTSVSSDNYRFRPVLSLKSCVTVKSGTGTSASPYQVEANAICQAASN